VRCRISFPGAVLMLALPLIGFGQSDTAQISGFVKDASAASVPKAIIVIANQNTGLERRTTTNDSGYYIVTSVPAGTYTITAEAAGFKKAQITQNRIESNLAATIDVTLEVGAISDRVEVVASAARIQADTASLGEVVDREQILNIQLNGRNPLFLAQLKPGVRGGSLAGFSYGLTTGGFAINGSRDKDNMLYFDGAVAVRTRSGGSSIGVADVDATEEVQVLTANYNAEYGRASGGQVRIVTRSGGRDFHGDLYEFFRNSAVDANSWARNRTIGNPAVSNSPAPYRYNQFGYNVNGPLFIPGKWNRDKSKLFFLWSQEWIRYRRDVSQTMTVPSLAMRNGDFSELLNPSNSFFGRARAIQDPLNGIPFPGNVIPAGRLSPNGLGLMHAYPLPTPGYLQGTSNVYMVAGAPINQRKDTVSIDFNPRDNHYIRFRNLNFNSYEYSPFDQGSDRTPSIRNRPNKTASVNYIWTVNPTMVNELLISASVDRVYINVDFSTGRAERTQYGINYPYIYPNGKEIPNKIPTVTIPNFSQLSGSKYPSQSTGPIYQISDNFTKTIGNHTLKLGGLFERAGQNDFDQIQFGAGVPGGTDNQNGLFAFTDTRTGAPTSGLAIGNVALGLFDTYRNRHARVYTVPRSYVGVVLPGCLESQFETAIGTRSSSQHRSAILQPLAQHDCL
jgi:Carboxypeptidase regulatory-like domain/TonB-dependent Receptor Plug Domain